MLMTAALCHPEMTNNFVNFPPVISNMSGMKWLSVIAHACTFDSVTQPPEIECLFFFQNQFWKLNGISALHNAVVIEEP